MNPEQKKLVFNEYFETEGSTNTLEIFPSTSSWKCFQVLVWKMRFGSTFKYATLDFPAFPSPRALI